MPLALPVAASCDVKPGVELTAVATAQPKPEGMPKPTDSGDVPAGPIFDVVALTRTEFDVLAVANAISERGLPGDVYRAATVRTGKLVR